MAWQLAAGLLVVVVDESAGKQQTGATPAWSSGSGTASPHRTLLQRDEDGRSTESW
jgi:hypothetical protein